MPKLLVVDDDPSLRRLTRVELGDSYEIIDSGEPEQGLALALEHRPDAILVDLRMPKYSGFELVHTYTSFSQTQNIPVIIVSGEAGSQTKEQCKKLGACGYFEKPIDFDALRTFLTQVVKNQKRVAPRSEVRVPLSMSLKLRGSNSQRDAVVASATTEFVSLSGFSCECNGEFPARSTLEVYMGGNSDVHVGKAQIVEVTSKAGIRHYFCRFLEKPSQWVLQ
jgi:CheY-like chemotaxis protein